MSKFIRKVVEFGAIAKHCVRHNANHHCRQNSLYWQRKTRSFSTALCSNDSFGTNPTNLQPQCISLACSNSLNRLLTTSSTESTSPANVDDLGSENLVDAWFNGVKPFGTVCIRDVPFDVYVQPLNPVDYPDLNKSIIKLYHHHPSDQQGNGEPLASHKLSKLGKLCDMKVDVGEDGEKVDVRCNIPSGVTLPLVCVITVPIKFGVDIQNQRGGSVTVSRLESDSVNIHLAQGDCHLVSLKTATVDVQCNEGSIICSKQVLGAIRMHCSKHGSIHGNRFQGGRIQCTTDSGDIDIKTVYAETSEYSSQSGNLHIRDCHGDTTVRSVHGDLTVDSLDGKLSAELDNGSADVFVTRQDGVSIRADQGNVTLRFTEDGSCSLDLNAQVIEQDESLKVSLDEQDKGFLNSKTDATVKASAPHGKISLKKQDWLSSIKLKFGNTVS